MLISRTESSAYGYEHLKPIQLLMNDNIRNTLRCIWMGLSGIHIGDYGCQYPEQTDMPTDGQIRNTLQCLRKAKYGKHINAYGWKYPKDFVDDFRYV